MKIDTPFAPTRIALAMTTLATLGMGTAVTLYSPISQANPVETSSPIVNEGDERDDEGDNPADTNSKSRITIQNFAAMAAPAQDPEQVWGNGLLSSTGKVADNNLAPSTISFGGYQFWKSNNPEIFNGPGWLMQNARSHATRGGRSAPLSGCTNVYYFHINKTGGVAYLHLLASNPQSAAVTVSAKGSTYTNSTKPLGGVATGQSYAVAKDWRDGSFPINFSNRSVPSATATEISKIQLNVNNMVDGRFEVCASAGIYLYTVITTGGSTTDAITKSQQGPAPGEIKGTSASTFGREAGIFPSSLVAGVTNVVLPAVANKHLGLAFNTTSKFNANLQEHTVGFTMRLSDSTDRSYGNYGHKYDVTYRLYNTMNFARRVRVSFASSLTNTVNTPSFTFSSPASLNGVNFNIYTTPTQPKQIIGTYSVPANGSFDARLTTFIAGLGVAGQQVILETID
jgi:hypothetical protein